MFSTVASGIMSVLAILLVIVSIRGLLAFVFAESRRWDAVTFNMKLLMVQGYPSDQMWRVWGSVGAVVVMLAASLVIWRIGGMMEPRQLGKILMSLGGAAILVAVLGPFSTGATVVVAIVGFVLLGGGYALRKMLGERAKQPVVPVLGLVGVVLLLIIALMYTVSLPIPARDDAGVQIITQEPIASSTAWPWTIIFLLGIGVYVLFAALRNVLPMRTVGRILITLWVLSFPVIFLVILRDPDIDWNTQFGFITDGADALLDLPWYVVALIFAAGGAFLLTFISRPTTGELGRVIGGVLLLVAFVSLAFPMAYLYRFLLFALAVFAMAAPTFGGGAEGNRRYITGWVGTAILIGLVVVIVDTDSLVDVPGSFFLGGLSLTILLAFTSIILSFPIGVVLALGRTSTMPIFRLISTVYIELVRGVPLITWLLVAFLMLPVALPEGVEIGNVMRAIGAMTFFSAAYLAENVRGGLQSIPNGQYEASKAMGMTTLQMTVFITLPQALRAVIPALVGQVIALFKDTSLVTIVGLFDFLHLARAVIPAQSQPFSFLGSIKETLIFAAAVYWMFTFTFSRISLRLEKKLGVGER
jgi:general L-amino acid transport system permease protein